MLPTALFVVTESMWLDVPSCRGAGRVATVADWEVETVIQIRCGEWEDDG